MRKLVVGLVILLSVSPLAVSAASLIPSTIFTAPSSTSVAIVYATDVPSNTWIAYGPDKDLEFEYKKVELATVHTAQLTGLTPGTTYYFHIRTSTSRTTTPVSQFKTLGSAASGSLTGFIFTRTLKQGDQGSDVKELQKLFNTDVRTQVAPAGPGSPGNETEYFGAATARATAAFQQLYAQDVLTPAGLARGTGHVGEFTRAKLNTLSRPAASSVIATTSGRTQSTRERSSSPSPTPSTPSPSPAPPSAAPVINSGEYYVTVTGAGTRSGDASNPFSLTEARAFANDAANLSKSMTFVLAAGEYGALNETKARSAGAWVTYRAADNNNKPIFRGSGIYAGLYIHDSSAAYLKFSNIAVYPGNEMAVEIESTKYVTIEDSYIEGVRTAAIIGYAARVWSSEQVTITDSTIKYGTNGVVAGSVKNFTLSNNEIASAIVDGIHIGDASDFIITENNVHDIADPTGIYPEAHQDSFQIDAGSGGVHRGVISKNQFKNSAGQGLFIWKMGGVAAYVIDTLTISDNSITGTYGASQFLVGGNNLTITGNTVTGSSPIINLILESSQNAVIRNNTFSGKFLNCSASGTQENNTFAELLQTGC